MNTVNEEIKQIVTEVAAQQGLEIGPVENHHAVVGDLGFSSLDVATLTALFEKKFGVNPFVMGIAAITEIRTVHDITQVYEKAIVIKDNPQAALVLSPAESSSRSEARNAAKVKRKKFVKR